MLCVEEMVGEDARAAARTRPAGPPPKTTRSWCSGEVESCRCWRRGSDCKAGADEIRVVQRVSLDDFNMGEDQVVSSVVML